MKTERLARNTKMIYLQCFQTPDAYKTSKYTPIYSRLPKISLLTQTDQMSDSYQKISLVTKFVNIA